MDNHLELSGQVLKRPETRVSPAGIPMTRFTLRHESVQREADMMRKVVCSITVVASGDEMSQTAQQLQGEQLVRVSGFISRANNRQGENWIILHAERIELL